MSSPGLLYRPEASTLVTSDPEGSKLSTPGCIPRAKANQVDRKGNQAGASCQKSDKLVPVDTKKELAKATGGRLSHDCGEAGEAKAGSTRKGIK